MAATRTTLPGPELKRLYEAGMTMRALGARYGVSPATVRRVLLAWQAEIRKPGHRRAGHQRVAAIREMRKGGKSWSQIGAVLGITRQAAHDLHRRYTA